MAADSPASSSTKLPQRGYGIALSALVALATLPKLLLILSPRADLLLNGSKGHPSTFKPEELDNGIVAFDLLNGTILNWLDYQHAAYFGGSLVVGTLATPFFWLFGSSIVSLKLTALAFNALAVALLFVIVDRWPVGNREYRQQAAWFAALLFALAPPHYTNMSVIAWGSHVEANGLNMVLLWCFLRAYESRGSTAAHSASPTSTEQSTSISFPWILASGLIAGLSLYFGYLAVLPMALLVGLRLCLLRNLPFKSLPRELLTASAGFLIGFSPWIVYNLRHGFTSLAAFQHAKGNEAQVVSLGERASKAWELISQHFQDSFFFQEQLGLPGGFWNGLAAATFGTFWLLGILRSKPAGTGESDSIPVNHSNPNEPGVLSWPALPRVALGYAALFLFVYTFSSGFQVGSQPDRATSYRYLVILFPFMCIGAGIGLAHWLPTKVSRFVLCAWLAVATWGSAQLVDLENFGQPLQQPGYSHRSLGRFIVGTYASDSERVLAAVDRAQERYTTEQLQQLYLGMAGFLRTAARVPHEHLHDRMQADFEHYEPLRLKLVERTGDSIFERIKAPSAAPASVNQRP